MMVQQFVAVLRCDTSARVYSRTVEVGVGETVAVGEAATEVVTVGD